MENFSEWATPELIWFLIGLVLLLMELAAPGLVIFFFGLGAWIVALLSSMIDISLNAQLIIFIVASLFLLLMLRHRLKPLFYGFGSTKSDMTEDMEEFVGETAIVRSEIRGKVKGRVELHGTNWDAIADETIPEGADVEIIGKDNITLKVKQI